MGCQLNQRAYELLKQTARAAGELRIVSEPVSGGGPLYDFGVQAEGGLAAGLALARICLADVGTCSLVAGSIADVDWPHVLVTSDHPTDACLLSQYAGWQVSVEKFFAMGSGPIRAAAGVEELFDKLNYHETPQQAVGVLETGTLPSAEIYHYFSEKTQLPPERIHLLVAPTASQAGNIQVVARSVETTLHKLFELGFDVRRIVSALGTAPLPPVAADDLTGIGRTNDAILYGARVVLWVRGDDESLAAVGPQVPASASEAYGKPFLEIFEEAGRDFYAIDPHLFSPAEVMMQNLDSGRIHKFGQRAPAILSESFGI
jgi:methenyltetrahydromethanopterin cyclohydrolase